MEAPIDRLPVEIWQDILLLAIESDGLSVFATTCTVSAFVHSSKLEDDSYSTYTSRRARLRQVCRAWNQFLLSTTSWWICIRGPTIFPRKTLDLPSITDQVPIIKRLSMTITVEKCWRPGVIWAFDLLKRVETPMLSFDLTLSLLYAHLSDEPHDVLAAVDHKVALHNLRIASLSAADCISISFAQLSAHFKDLVSLSLFNVIMHSMEELTLPRLEYLYLYNTEEPTLETQGWNLPRLRHVYLGLIFFPFDTLNFLERCASQLESLILLEPCGFGGLPRDFWDSFPALQLLGVRYKALANRTWDGWATTPPRAHPFRYLLCCEYDGFDRKIDSIRSNWKYHEEVAFVVEERNTGQHYLVEDIKKEGGKTRMTKINGLFPCLSFASLLCK